MKRIIYLAAAALVALLIFAPAAMAQGKTGQAKEEIKMEKTESLPSSGGPAVSSLVLPATALLVGSGVMAYAVLRRRR